MIAKASGGILGIGLLGTGSIAMAKPHWLGMDYMPNYTTLSKKESTLTGKWVKDYRIYFVDSEGNDYWFDWVFRNRYNNEDSKNKTAFAGIKQGWGNTTNNSLAKACKDAYAATTANVKANSSEATTSETFSEDNIWKYCSVGGKKLKKVSEGKDKEKYNSKLGQQNSSELLSVEEDDNDWAWHIKQKEFLNGATPDTGVFRKFYKDNQKHKNETNGTKLREECKNWYKENEKSSPNDDSKLTTADLKKYCSLKEAATQ